MHYNASLTCILFEYAIHYATFGNQEQFSEVVPFRPEQCCGDDIRPGLKATIGSQFYKLAKAVLAERFVNFKQADLPRESGMFHGGKCGRPEIGRSHV